MSITQSDLIKPFLPVAEDEHIARWRQNQVYLMQNAFHSLGSLTKLAKEDSVLLGAAKELKNSLININCLQSAWVSEPGQLRELFPARSWLPWVPTILDQICGSSQLLVPFLANFEMVKMAQVLVLPETRYSMALHERARVILLTYARLNSGAVACDDLTMDVLKGPVLFAESYLASIDDHSGAN